MVDRYPNGKVTTEELQELEKVEEIEKSSSSLIRRVFAKWMDFMFSFLRR